jgi:hypothetical protein
MRPRSSFYESLITGVIIMLQPIRMVCVAILASCATSAMVVPVAFADEAPHWMVEGVKLKAGESRKTVGKNVGVFTMGAGEMKVVCQSATSAGALGENATAVSGTRLSECAIPSQPGCQVHSEGEPSGTIVSGETSGELIFLGTKEEAKVGSGRLGELIKPSDGEYFAAVELEGSECSVKGTVRSEGDMIAEIEPADTEVEVGRVVFPDTMIGEGYEWEGAHKVKKITASLESAGEPVTISGEEELELESKEKFGAFG